MIAVQRDDFDQLFSNPKFAITEFKDALIYERMIMEIRDFNNKHKNYDDIRVEFLSRALQAKESAKSSQDFYMKLVDVWLSMGFTVE